MEPPPSNTLGSTLQPLNSHLEKARWNVDEMRKPLDALTATIDGLQGQTMQIALLGEVGTRQEIAGLRTQIRNQDQKHKDGIKEIQGILDDLLQNQVVEHMRKEVEQEISNQINVLVQEQVAECLKDHIPQALQVEVEGSKRELDRLNTALHNSESRRSNGNLRTNQVDDLLATMFMLDGTVSPRFPKDLKGLFSLDAETTRVLMDDYGIPNPSASRDHNLNRLMQFCGVRYQLVE